MKKIKTQTDDGWIIYPPEHTQNAQRWIKIIEALPEPPNLSGISEANQTRETAVNELFYSQ